MEYTPAGCIQWMLLAHDLTTTCKTMIWFFGPCFWPCWDLKFGCSIHRNGRYNVCTNF